MLNDVCARTDAAPIGSGLINYPSGLRDYNYAVLTDFIVPQEVISGSKRIYAHGCFAYRTFGEVHKSEYCFLFVPVRNTGKYVGAHCPYGNAAN
jgi:hypothetical protein